MPVTRINHFHSKVGEEGALFEKLRAVVSMIAGFEGCKECRILQKTDSPAHIVIIEEWLDEAAHKSALASVPPETFGPAMALLAEPPNGAFYTYPAAT